MPPAPQALSVYEATLHEFDQRTAEISTAGLRRVLADRSALVLDTRKPAEFAAGHVPGAKNVPSLPNMPSDEPVGAVEQLVHGDKSRPVVLYCNGPRCQGSRRLGEQLADAGFANVRRYQLGMPVWRALGGPTQIELEGIARVFRIDRTAVFLDARSSPDFQAGSLEGARSTPADDLPWTDTGALPLPRDDFNTRIVVFGRNAEQARAVAEALSSTPFHNVMYFAGSFEKLSAALHGK